MVESLVKSNMSDLESEDIGVQQHLFQEWSAERKQLVEEQLKLYLKKERHAEIEKQLQELQEKEEFLRYFELRDKIIMKKILAPEITPPREEDDEDSLRAKRIKRRKYRHHV